MKRLLPVLIAVTLIFAVFCLLPKSEQSYRLPETLNDLNGCRVGIQTGLNYENYLARSCPEAEPVFFSEYRSMFPALQQGKLDAMLTESTSFIVERVEYKGLAAIGEPLDRIECGIGVSPNGMGRALLIQLNAFIAECRADGTRGAMTDYWLVNYDRGHTSVDKSGITGENGVVTFAAEAAWEPMCFVGSGGELQGYDVDFIYRFCRKYGYTPEIIPLEFDAMSAALASGKCSVAMGLVEDEERSEAVRFTDSYVTYDVIAVYFQGAEKNVPFLEGIATSFEKTFIRENRWKLFLEGAGTTLLIAALSVLFGTGLGLLLYLWVANGKKAEQTVTNIIGWIAGSTPTVVFLMILYYIVFGAYTIGNVAVSIVGFTIVFGSSFYEKILSGVKAVGPGQAEAARAQGFTAFQTFFLIQFPQAIDHMAPNYQSDVISLIQDTSVVGYIAVLDLTKMSDLIRGRTYEPFFPLIATALIYYLIIWLVTWLLRKVFNALNNRNRKEDRILKGITPVSPERQEEG